MFKRKESLIKVPFIMWITSIILMFIVLCTFLFILIIYSMEKYTEFIPASDDLPEYQIEKILFLPPVISFYLEKYNVSVRLHSEQAIPKITVKEIIISPKKDDAFTILSINKSMNLSNTSESNMGFLDYYVKDAERISFHNGELITISMKIIIDSGSAYNEYMLDYDMKVKVKKVIALPGW